MHDDFRRHVEIATAGWAGYLRRMMNAYFSDPTSPAAVDTLLEAAVEGFARYARAPQAPAGAAPSADEIDRQLRLAEGPTRNSRQLMRDMLAQAVHASCADRAEGAGMPLHLAPFAPAVVGTALRDAVEQVCGQHLPPGAASAAFDLLLREQRLLT